jgi:hypothetical protein
MNIIITSTSVPEDHMFVFKHKMMKGGKLVSRTWEDAHKILVGKPEGKLGLIWKYNT